MRKNLGLMAAVIAVAGYLSMGSAVMAKDFSVAIVDVPQVVNASAQVQALKKDQQAKAEEIVKDVASITDANKKKAAEEKYNKELMAKKEKMDQDYAAKLKALDTSISQQINEKAKADGYDLVLSKGIVLFGGNDITSEIIKVVK